MRILVHEYASGGGFAGRDVPPTLAREGAAIRAALIADLAALNCHSIVTTADTRFPLAEEADVEVHTVHPGPSRPGSRHEERAASASAKAMADHGSLWRRWSAGRELLNHLIASADAVWLVAPETNRCLERVATRVEQQGKLLLGPGALAIRHASDKAGLRRRLVRCGVPCPETRVLRRNANPAAEARALGYPLVVKPGRGAGCMGVCLVRSERELHDAIDIARSAGARGPWLMQRFVRGTAASVSVLADGHRCVALSLNRQLVRVGRRFSYLGGCTPLDHPLACRAIDVALRACRASPGLRGYIGVDLVLTRSEAFVIEVNPRLTTAYLGVRSALGQSCSNGSNIAGMAIAACAGHLPEVPPLQRRVRFTSSGRVEAAP
jgi:predicted ATP-grasp superfamily ATP-dependent carboligase